MLPINCTPNKQPVDQSGSLGYAVGKLQNRVEKVNHTRRNCKTDKKGVRSGSVSMGEMGSYLVNVHVALVDEYTGTVHSNTHSDE